MTGGYYYYYCDTDATDEIDSGLSEEEKFIVQGYRGLNNSGKESVAEFISLCKNNNRYQEKVIQINRYL